VRRQCCKKVNPCEDSAARRFNSCEDSVFVVAGTSQVFFNWLIILDLYMSDGNVIKYYGGLKFDIMLLTKYFTALLGYFVDKEASSCFAMLKYWLM